MASMALGSEPLGAAGAHADSVATGSPDRAIVTGFSDRREDDTLMQLEDPKIQAPPPRPSQREFEINVFGHSRREAIAKLGERLDVHPNQITIAGRLPGRQRRSGSVTATPAPTRIGSRPRRHAALR